jgi:hypothetical protein
VTHQVRVEYPALGQGSAKAFVRRITAAASGRHPARSGDEERAARCGSRAAGSSDATAAGSEEAQQREHDDDDEDEQKNGEDGLPLVGTLSPGCAPRTGPQTGYGEIVALVIESSFG